MKIPLIWLKDYIDTGKSAKELSASFTQLGLMLDKPLDDSGVLDLEHRMDRSDWLSILGCARDLAAFEGKPLKYPEVSVKPGMMIADAEKIVINIETPVVRRFQTRIFKGLKVGASPKWLVDRLKAYGMDSINNIVDITNFVMVEYGQPLHAQDISTLPGMDITIRQAKSGEELTTILGTKISLTTDTHILTSGGVPTVILGIVGGRATSVKDSTVDIILDSGNYDSRVIRKSSRQLKILNETVSREDKFLDPRLVDFALDRATDLILQLAGGIYYTNDDYYKTPVTPKTMDLRLARLSLLSGMDLNLSLATKILESLEYKIIESKSDSLTVEIPYFRTDIEVEDDLISDILRIHNYTNIPLCPLSSPVPLDITPAIYRFEDNLRDLLVAQGGHEHITNSLVTSGGTEGEVILANALSSDQNALRTDLSLGLSHVLSTYKKHKIKPTFVFEIGKVFKKVSNGYRESRELTVTSDASSLSTLLSSLGIDSYQISSTLDIVVSGHVVGQLTSESYTIYTESLMPLTKKYTGIVSEFSHLTTYDLSLITQKSTLYTDIVNVIQNLEGQWQSISWKSKTQMKDGTNNYLVSVSWDSSCQTIDSDKDKILKILKEKLGIISTS